MKIKLNTVCMAVCGIALIMMGACASGVVTTLHTEPFITGGTLIWSDEFDGDSLDMTKWNYDLGTGAQYPNLNGWGNEERQYYRPENVSVKNGCLYLEARKDNASYNNGRDVPAWWGNIDYTSGKITTGGNLEDDAHTVNKSKFLFQTGDRVEARIKVPRGVGFWPAFWMMGATTNAYNGAKKNFGWPRGGEIDVLETVGGREHQFGSTIHFGSSWEFWQHTGNTYKLNPSGPNLADNFNVYGVYWDIEKLHFIFNGEIWHTIDLAALDAEDVENKIKEAFGSKAGFFINLNFAVGGNYLGKAIPADSVFAANAPYDDRCLIVDWVRVYRK